MKKLLPIIGLVTHLLYFAAAVFSCYYQNPQKEHYLLILCVFLVIAAMYFHFLEAAISFWNRRVRLDLIRLLLILAGVPLYCVCMGKSDARMLIWNGYFLLMFVMQTGNAIYRAVRRRRHFEEDEDE